MRKAIGRVLVPALALAIVLPAPAQAADPAPTHPLGLSAAPNGPWTTNLTEPLFSSAALWVPGDAETAAFWARNQSTDDTEFRVQVTPQIEDLASSGQLDLRVRADGGAWEPLSPTWSSPSSLSPGERTHVEIRATLPASSTNASQGLEFSFAVRARLTSTGAGYDRPPAPVPTPSSVPAPVPSPSSVPLPTAPTSDAVPAPLPGAGSPSTTTRTPDDGDLTPAPAPDPAPDAAAPLDDGVDQGFWLPALVAALTAGFWLVMLVRRRNDESEAVDQA